MIKDDKKYIDKVKKISPFPSPDKQQVKMPSPMSEETEHDLLSKIQNTIDSIEKKEVISKEKVDKLPE